MPETAVALPDVQMESEQSTSPIRLFIVTFERTLDFDQIISHASWAKDEETAINQAKQFFADGDEKNWSHYHITTTEINFYSPDMVQYVFGWSRG